MNTPLPFIALVALLQGTLIYTYLVLSKLYTYRYERYTGMNGIPV